MTNSTRTITLSDVASLAKVSKSVASRVLSGDEKSRISADARLRVHAAAKKLEYVPDHRARALRSLRAGAIALVVPDVGNSVFSALFGGVQEAANDKKMTVLLGQMNEPDDAGIRLAGIVGQGRVDGVVLQRHENIDDRTLANAMDARLPVVLFNSTLRNRRGSVILDDARAAQLATEHLLALGHRRVAFLGGTATHDAARRRESGYRAAMRAAGLRIDREWVTASGWEADAGEQGLVTLLNAKRRPTGIVVASVNAAVGAGSAAARQGITVPDELSIVTVQDTWVARTATPAITVVRMPLKEAGYAAAQMLIRHLDGEPLSDIVITEPRAELLIRASTGPPKT